ncbi:MarR family winged helix-turn-helix transcriptional regulator [Dictyobacter aurantiacus]|uniref:HTH marR-type domain-containing protein n=1 Tax=Dictyobacter aurantiacus TaxID=1936993 RepID=A0A401ZLK4_9CHLR|nr:MarR family transcriptional regulator [Dictyobacter aurantiacus]GCE07733.1 hypothetical protein KDAU_50620 [Dictyobacter aurantiacus]
MSQEGDVFSTLDTQEQVFFSVWNEVRQQGTRRNFRLSHEQEMSATQFTILGLIEKAQGEDYCTIGWLARQMDLDPATVVRSLDHLEKRQYVLRRRSTQDRRQVIVSLTAEGQATQQAIHQRFMKSLLCQFRRMSSSGQEALLRGLQEFLSLGRDEDLLL